MWISSEKCQSASGVKSAKWVPSPVACQGCCARCPGASCCYATGLWVTEGHSQDLQGLLKPAFWGRNPANERAAAAANHNIAKLEKEPGNLTKENALSSFTFNHPDIPPPPYFGEGGLGSGSNSRSVGLTVCEVSPILSTSRPFLFLSPLAACTEKVHATCVDLRELNLTPVPLSWAQPRRAASSNSRRLDLKPGAPTRLPRPLHRPHHTILHFTARLHSDSRPSLLSSAAHN